MLRSAAPIWNGRGSLGMTKEMLWFLMGHLVCIGQWAAFIMVDHAFLGRGRRFRFPCLWAALLAAVFLAASIRHDIGFFNIGSVILNVIYLLVTVLFFGGSWNQKLSACLVNGIMCLLTENTVSYTFAWCKHIPVREVWRYRSCLFLLVAAVVGAGLLAAYIIRRGGRGRSRPAALRQTDSAGHGRRRAPPAHSARHGTPTCHRKHPPSQRSSG